MQTLDNYCTVEEALALRDTLERLNPVVINECCKLANTMKESGSVGNYNCLDIIGNQPLENDSDGLIKDVNRNVIEVEVNLDSDHTIQEDDVNHFMLKNPQPTSLETNMSVIEADVKHFLPMIFRPSNSEEVSEEQSNDTTEDSGARAIPLAPKGDEITTQNAVKELPSHIDEDIHIAMNSDEIIIQDEVVETKLCFIDSSQMGLSSCDHLSLSQQVPVEHTSNNPTVKALLTTHCNDIGKTPVNTDPILIDQYVDQCSLLSETTLLPVVMLNHEHIHQKFDREEKSSQSTTNLPTVNMSPVPS
jgi:hypothetical protein